ncbi:MAG: hypothetical protein HYS20_13595 [Rhodocyclales bacterium]|nr:hypothetical protein [Rhodocyclales bacterium]
MKKFLVLLTVCVFLAGCLSSPVPLIPETDLVLPFQGDTRGLLFNQDRDDPTRWDTEPSESYLLKRRDKRYALFGTKEGASGEVVEMAEIAFADLNAGTGLLLVQLRFVGQDSSGKYSYGIIRRVGEKLFFAFPRMRDVSSGDYEKLWAKYACKSGTWLLGDTCRDFQSYEEVREVLEVAEPSYKAYMLIR